VFCLLLFQIPIAHAKLKISEEEKAFDEESSELLKNAVARLFLGRHGELIIPHAAYNGDGQLGCANVLARADGKYGLAVFAYPARYYYGLIAPSGEIQYGFDRFPPGIDASTFIGPKHWPYLEENGRPKFHLQTKSSPSPLALPYQAAKTVVLADTNAIPIQPSANKQLRAVVYACADNAFYITKDNEIHSPYALLLLESEDRMSLDAISQTDPSPSFFSVINGGRTGSTVIFRRNTNGSLITPECRKPWPYLDKDGRPVLPDFPFRMVVGDYVTRAWLVQSDAGVPPLLRVAPIP
jgi:hypothetical protein